jgi:type II restriction/modification system DNA methylase subunit YeeA
MDQSALKKFAQSARERLHELVENRLVFWLGTGSSNPDSAAHRQFAPQIRKLEEMLAKEGRAALIERVAYTWFNRLAALRFMDANGYHTFGSKVVSPSSDHEVMPEILQQARGGTLDSNFRQGMANAEAIEDILAGRIPSPDPQAEAYRLLLVAACNHYHALMPFLFEQIGDATELLLPEDVLTEHSIVHTFRTGLADEDCRDVEVIGWLYQFYISDKKDAVMARKSAVPTEDIPAVTQLFTPHWIVRYLVENSLGRLWLLNRPNSKLRALMPYYIEGEAETDFLKITKPEDIKLIDPASGSGHMLTYSFDLLYAMYEEEGYDAPEIPGLILKHNLHGVDICDRAAALAAFALCMKARAKDARFFRRMVQPNIVELRDVKFEENELRDYIRAIGVGDLFNKPMLKLLHQFEEAKNFGSLIQPCLDEPAIAFARRAIEIKDLGGQLFLRETHRKVLRVLEQAEVLTQRYQVVVANPPYMGTKGMNASIKILLEEKFSNYKTDLFSAFVVRSQSLALVGGNLGFMTPFVWMFITSYEQLRRRLIDHSTITSLVQLEYSGFDGATVPICTFTIQNQRIPNYRGGYVRLSAFRGSEHQSPKTLEAIANPACGWFFRASSEDYKKIPGCPIAYWTTQAVIAAFENSIELQKLFMPRQGMATTNNSLFVRCWPEVSIATTKLDATSQLDAGQSGRKWFPYNKGGEFRKWYGNNDFLVNYENNGKTVCDYIDNTPGVKVKSNGRVINRSKYFLPSLTWSKVSSGSAAFRYQPNGYVFDVAGTSIFADSDENLLRLAGLMNSTVVRELLKFLAPTLNFEVGQICRVPLISGWEKVECVEAVQSMVGLSKSDWDNFETSWDFRDLSLLRKEEVRIRKDEEAFVIKGQTLSESWANWKRYCDAAIHRMQELETENNRLFIAAYGLEGELQPEVPEEQITLARADQRTDMGAFVSYAIGCMFGRYSLDAPGLILSDAGATVQDYMAKVQNPSFAPDADGILPVLDGDWFSDDIVGRLREFLRVTFGEAKLAENIAFLETAIGKDLRKYLAKDFYKDHLKTYKKRPIYWMVSSPQGSFQALIYLHRYNRDTVNLLLNDYVRSFLHKLEERHRQLTAITLDESVRPAERTRAAKELTKIEKMLKEIRAWERDIVLPLAQKRLEIDLDDGVKVNYLKFKGPLETIPGLDKKEED